MADIFILITFADMNRRTVFQNLMLPAFAAALLLISCGRSAILKKDTVSNIMYEIFVADEYARTYSYVNLAADSVLLYQHIFDKYGCTLEDYQRSVKYYLSDDKAFTQILKTATEIARVNAKTAEKELNTEKHGLYFNIPYKLPEMLHPVDDWWSKDIRGERLRYGQFYANLKRVLVKKTPEPVKTEPKFIPKQEEAKEHKELPEGRIRNREHKMEER